jgi:hypothetical protein
MFHIALWSLDDNGDFSIHISTTWYSSVCTTTSKIMSKNTNVNTTNTVITNNNTDVDRLQPNSIASLVYNDLLEIENIFHLEYKRFQRNQLLYQNNMNYRLLYLFQKDLLPGISGEILENKNIRDDHNRMNNNKHFSMKIKMVTWLFLLFLNIGMLFYVFLFAIYQDNDKQEAWIRSFGMWLVSDIVIINTITVITMNIMLPSLIMKDVQLIKKKLINSLLEYYDKIHKEEEQYNNRKKMKHKDSDSSGVNGVENNNVTTIITPNNSDNNTFYTSFNAAEYLFLSHRLAKQFKYLKVSKIIVSYNTIWPKQSYQHVDTLNNTYNTKYNSLITSVTMIILFFISNLIIIPISIQDIIIHVITSMLAGYAFLIHIQLYYIYPILIVLPTIVIGIFIHFLFQGYNHHHKQNRLITLIKDYHNENQNKKMMKNQSKDSSGDHDDHNDDIELTNTLQTDRNEDVNNNIIYHTIDNDNCGNYEYEGGGNSIRNLPNDTELISSHSSLFSFSSLYSLPSSSSSSSLSSSFSSSSPSVSERDDDDDDVNTNIPIQPHMNRRQSIQTGLKILQKAQTHIMKYDNNNTFDDKSIV